MPLALFVLGSSGSGKTNLSKKFIKSRNSLGEVWTIIDKDDVGEFFSSKIFSLLNVDNEDRDSELFQTHIRDYEYKTALLLASQQLKLGINVVLPGPWTKEINNSSIFDVEILGFPKDTTIGHVYLNPPEFKLKNRIETRSHPKDKWKLEHWADYSKRIVRPENIPKNNILTFNMFEDFYQQEYQIMKMFKIKKEQNEKLL